MTNLGEKCRRRWPEGQLYRIETMAVANHRDVVEIADRAEPAPKHGPQREASLGQAARHWANGLSWLPAVKQSSHYAERVAALNRRLEPLLAQLDFTLDPDEQLPEDLQWMFDNVRLVRMTQGDVKQAVASLRRVPHARTPDKTVMPRVLAIAQDFLQRRRVSVFRPRLRDLRRSLPVADRPQHGRAVAARSGDEAGGAGGVRHARRRGAASAGRRAQHQYADRLDARSFRSAVEGIAGAADRLRASSGAGSGEGLRAHGLCQPRALSPHRDALRRALRLLGVGDRRHWRWSWRRSRRSIRRAIRGWPGDARMWAIT